MGPKTLTQLDPEALRNFIHGRTLLESYLSNGRGETLQDAERSFANAVECDQHFDLAKLYLATTHSELREPDAAIVLLQELAAKNEKLSPDAYIQLAYAQLKKYEDTSYVEAKKALDQALEQAKRQRRKDLPVVIEAYTIFVLAVTGGRSSLSNRDQLLDEAIKRGEALLHKLRKSHKPRELAAKFEALNALGIAYMWKGRRTDDPTNSENAFWSKAERYYREALDLRPNSVRTLQNLGTLEQWRGDQHRRTKEPKAAIESYERSKSFFRRSLDLNSYDQFPHYRLAVLCIRTGNWDDAEKYLREGQKQKGAVKTHQWDLVQKAIASRTEEPLDAPGS